MGADAVDPPAADSAAAASDELYGGVPSDFTGRRDELAKQARAAGEAAAARAIRALRRPSVAAWAVNQLARQRGDDVERFTELAEQLRQAQADRNAGRMRELTERRRRVEADLLQAARDLADQNGHPLGGDAERQVAATLDAAVADPRAAEAVASGQLVSALSYSGFGEVDLADALAEPSGRRASDRGKPAGGSAERRDAERRDAERRDAERRDAERRDAERREADVREAERRAQAREKRAAAAAQVEKAETEVEQRRAELADAEAALRRARAAFRAAEPSS